MADYDSVKQRIISSVFSRRNAASTGAEEAYVAHVKIFEDSGEDEGGRKPRYIIISRKYIASSSLPTSQGCRGWK